MMLRREGARKFVVNPIADYKLDFIMRPESGKILHAKRVRLARIRTLHVHNLNHPTGGAQRLHFIEHLHWSYLLPAVKTVFRIAPVTAQIAPREPHEHTWQPRVG